MRAQRLIGVANPVTRGHRVGGQHVLPGLAYIDLLFQTLRKKGHDYRARELRNFSIRRPLLVSAERSVLLHFDCAEKTSGESWGLVVEGQARSNDGSTGEQERYVTAELHRVHDAAFDEAIDLDHLRRSANRALRLDDVYEQYRQVQLVHDTFMRAQGSLYCVDSAIYVDCHLSDAALPSAANLMFHPALIDGSAACGGSAALLSFVQNAETRLALPLFFESFRATELLQTRCVARVQSKSIHQKNELSYCTLEFFNETGLKVAELKNFASKAIRDLTLLAADAVPATKGTARHFLGLDTQSGVQAAASPILTPTEQLLRELIADKLQCSQQRIDPSVGYYDLGMDSAALLDIVQAIGARIGATLAPTLLFEFVTIHQLADHLSRLYGDQLREACRARGDAPLPDRPDTRRASRESGATPEDSGSGDTGAGSVAADDAIAIVGMAGRFPSAASIREFWENLRAGRDCVAEIPAERWDWRRFETYRSPSGKSLSRWGGFIDDVDCFDPQFFRISPQEAENMDPQERLFLQTCWEAIEDAGYTPATLVAPHARTGRRSVGVFAGVMHKDYALIANDALASGHKAAVIQSNASVANRVSYCCNFHGPSVVVDTVCSSSLIAVHWALQSLRSGECEVALAGGVNLSLHPAKYVTYGMMDMHASDGRCRTFGSGGDGYVASEAVGAVLLKPLRKAVADGDPVYAVVRSSSTNHTGTVSGFTVPSPVAQADLITSCLERARVAAHQISYVEAHGTGTSLGDPIEIDGLSKAFGRSTQKLQFCAIGSVKSNMGHAEAAAGICGLIKVALQLHHRTLVPSLHSQELNPHVDWKHTPFFVQRQTQPWLRSVGGNDEVDARLRATVSSFGASGSNACVLLEEYSGASDEDLVSSGGGLFIVPLSAQTPERLRTYAQRVLEYFECAREGLSLADAAYTLQVGRREMPVRVAFAVADWSELLTRLSAFCRGESETPRSRGTEWEIVAQQWASGATVDWSLVREGRRCRRVSLPGYPFAREKFWIDTGAEQVGAAVGKAVLFDRGWVEEASAATGDAQFGSRVCVLLGAECGRYVDQIARPHAGTTVEVLKDLPADPVAALEICTQRMFGSVQTLLRARPGKPVLLQLVLSGDPSQGNLLSALTGLLLTARIEQPLLNFRTIELADATSLDRLPQILEENIGRPGEGAREILYRNGRRHIVQWRHTEPGAPVAVPWKNNGVYLITGGAGGLGSLFAEEIAKRAHSATIVLADRVAMTPELHARIDRMAENRARIEYRQVDVSDAAETGRLLQWIHSECGQLNGILHSAGVTKDSFLIRKTPEEISAVLAPKIAGTVNLDLASKGFALDFFCLFSSDCVLFGNTGQADYVLANMFLDRYAEYRNALVRQGQRRGFTQAIDWTLWSDVGMRMGEVQRSLMREMGLGELSREDGLAAFYAAHATGLSQVLVLAGDRARVGSFVEVATRGSHAAPEVRVEPMPAAAQDVDLHGKTVAYLTRVIAKTLKLPPERIEPAAPFEEFGLDSIMSMTIVNELQLVFGPLSKTLLFEFQNTSALGRYFVEHHHAVLSARFGAPVAVAESVQPAPRKSPHVAVPAAISGIAVIGLSGRYPQASNVHEFWKNLEAGKDCIESVQASRWRGAEAADQGGSYWCGLLQGFAEFDRKFFNISSREATSIDPQERLFLETSWAVLEDAGYTREALAKHYRGRVGVFVGITKNGFDLYGLEQVKRGGALSPRTSFSSVANRVSYLLDLHGPSMPIDTMCSSSLTAIHEACEHLIRGECELAIAGGVNVYVHPSSLTALSDVRMLASNGRCRSFGAGGDGFAPGEGVGAVLLKPLDRAIEDRDHIYGVIKGTGINHSGKTNGYMVPNPVAQRELIERVLEKANVDARAVSYIEAHGTGTELGDAMEVTSLTQAFAQHTSAKQYCALGSAKSNIGHLESAAGIAGVTKVLLQMKHRLLVPSLHSQTLNPHIDFERTPFQVQQAVQEWRRPVVEEREYPRIAGISSFGAGGANAHVIIEEYVEPSDEASASDRPALIVLSAKSEEPLRQQAQQLLGHASALKDEDLRNVAYTLQVGREALEYRLALTATSVQQLQEKLSGYLAGKLDNEGIEECYRGDVKKNREALSILNADETLQQALGTWVEQGKFTKLLDLWVKGLSFDWERLYADRRARRVSLPTYPFARERYWVEGPAAVAQPGVHQLHPLLHRNTSDLNEQRFSTRLSGDEFYLVDHVVNGQKVLPGVCYLEMARAAVAHSAVGADGQSLTLKDVVWLRALGVSEACEVHIAVCAEDTGDLEFEIYRGEASAEVVHAQGRAQWVQGLADEVVNVEALASRCTQQLTAEECYGAFSAMGLAYGPAHRGLQSLRAGEDESGAPLAVARVQLPANVSGTSGEHLLHPSVLDSALQASIGVGLAKHASGLTKAMVPFAVERVEIRSRTPQLAWVVVRSSGASSSSIQKLDIDVCDEGGRVCVRLRGLSARALEVPDAVAGASAQTLLLKPEWKTQPLPLERSSWTGARVVLLASGYEENRSEVLSACVGASVELLPSQEPMSCAQALFTRVQALLKNPSQPGVLLQIVLESSNAALAQASSALLRTAAQENPKLQGQLITLSSQATAAELIEALEGNASDPQVRHVGGERQVMSYRELAVDTAPLMPWKTDGVYWITGGAGGLGLIVAREIGRQAPGARILLSGRSEPDAEKQRQLEELRGQGLQLEYRALDITQAAAVKQCVQELLEKYGQLTGIIHCAGVTRDNYILRKTPEELEAVLAPKVLGAMNLDEATRDVPLDCLILFSSVSGAFGNPGQSDYAFANAFMDGVAAERNARVAQGERHGRTLSINWPLWAEGGMRLDAALVKLMRSQGMDTLSTPAGLQALYSAWASREPQVVVLAGDRRRLQKLFAADQKPKAPDTTSFLQNVQRMLVQLVAQQLNVKEEDIDLDAILNDLGFDSIAFTTCSDRLNQAYALDLAPTIFFEYPTIRSFAEYLVQEHRVALAEKFSVPAVARESAAREPAVAAVTPPPQRRRRSRGTTRVASSLTHREPIAIVGVSGRFPGAADVDAFWENLRTDKDCITEVPVERWDWRAIYGDPVREPNKTNVKWGGFIDGLEDFDPLFFGIAPKEAELMDPQQRLLMLHTWKAIEDAGYSTQSLWGTRTGVFVGTASSGYHELAAQANVAIEGYSSTSAVSSVGPNRISFLLNLHGPSEPIETACSSSLVAVHRAVRAIQAGDCDMALVGGANTILTPWGHISFGKAGMLSPDGRCKSFSKDANGYARGEGVGMLFLKKLSDAERDGDQIWALIRGSAENHGGRANSLTAPNPKAQAELLRSAYREAKIDPRSVTYIEAHGTGTSLGDPIEINALLSAFKSLHDDMGSDPAAAAYCGIGTVKTNIGHLELAAGVAGMIKVLLQMRHKTLVKSLHCEELNPYVRLQDSPFYIVNGTQPWQARRDSTERPLPLRAGVSSFGFGGVNAHVILEEHLGSGAFQSAAPDHPLLIVLSARTAERLQERVSQLLAYIDANTPTNAHLTDLAFTLQVGRDAMEQRLAFAVASVEELRAKLAACLDSSEVTEGFHRGTVKATGASDEHAGEVDACISARQYSRLPELWVRGTSVDWRRLYAGSRPRRLRLPTYPFERRRCWITPAAADPVVAAVPQTQEVAPPPSLPPPAEQVPSPPDFNRVTDAAALPRVREELADLFCKVLHLRRDDFDCETSFGELGVDSVYAVELLEAINRRYNLRLRTSVVFEFSNIEMLAQYLVTLVADGEQPRAENEGWTDTAPARAESIAPPVVAAPAEVSDDGIAVIGLSCRCAGASDQYQFWELIRDGRDCIDAVKHDPWREAFSQCSITDPIRYGAMEETEYFDCSFFNISPREALSMDPSQRILLEECYRALEDSGHSPKSLGGTDVGVVIGAMQAASTGEDGSHFSMLGNENSILAARISYFLNLKGPALAVNTACSSSLVAVDLACQKLRLQEIQLAIAGGITVYTHPGPFIGLHNAGMLSPRATCRPFDDDADGIVVGDGVGIVVLKRLADARRDGDRIYGVIRGSGTNQDGRTSGLTVPSFLSQSKLIETIYRRSRVDASQMQFIEAHGTATKLGDPIEIHALTHAFAQFTDKKQFCAVGSVKANIGHTTAAAGVLSLIKVCLSMQHRQIPPSINYRQQNQHIDFANSPVYVNTQLREWPVNAQGLRLAAVSSFGFSGTNAHLVLEQHRDELSHAHLDASAPARPRHALIVLSARTDERLQAQARRLLDWVVSAAHGDEVLYDLAYTLQIGRDAMGNRVAFAVGSMEELRGVLSTFIASNARPSTKTEAHNEQPLTDEEQLRLVADCTKAGSWDRLLDLWMRGSAFDWRHLYGDGSPYGVRRPRRVGVPGYGFSKDWSSRSPLLSATVALSAEPHISVASKITLPPLAAVSADELDLSKPAAVSLEVLGAKPPDTVAEVLRCLSSRTITAKEAQESLRKLGIETL